MKKKMELRVLAIALVLSLVFPIAVSAVPAPTTPAGAATVVNPVFNVTLPANLNFTIDPFEIRTDGAEVNPQPLGQIHSVEYVVINRSNVPVTIAADFVAQRLNADIDLTSDVTDILSTDKVANIAIEFATGVENTFRLNTTVAAQNVFDFEWETLLAPPVIQFTNDSGSIVGNATAMAIAAWNGPQGLAARENATRVYFLLDSAADHFNPGQTALVANQLVADPEDRVSAFRITGEVATYAPWVVADIRLFSRFTISPRATSHFDALDTYSLPLGPVLTPALNVATELRDEA